MAEYDGFADLLAKEGEPDLAERVTADESAKYDGRLPKAMLQFWALHGRGSYRQGRYWICDPAPFQAVVEELFAGDSEFDPKRLTVFGHSGLGDLDIWDTRRKRVSVATLESEVSNHWPEAFIDPRSGAPFSDDSIIGVAVSNLLDYGDETDDDGVAMFPAASRRVGDLRMGEIFGFVPALALGGERDFKNLRRVRAAEHLLFLAQLDRFWLTRLTPPAPPSEPFGRVVRVRRLGNGPSAQTPSTAKI